jgi:hypothetical protein
MKIALCFSGFIRDVEETKVFWTALIKKYNIDVYASFWDDEIPQLGDTIKNFETIYTPKRLEVESYEIFKETTQNLASMNIQSPKNIADIYQKSSEAFNQISMYYKVWKANMLSKQIGIEYDLVIRARIDTVLDEGFEIVDNDMLNLPMGTNNCPAFHQSDGLNDCFAYGRPKIMDYYSFIYLHMMDYLNQGHYLFPPEHFLAVHFSKIRIPIRFFANYMMISRVSKKMSNEIYNHFAANSKDLIEWSDRIDFNPDPNYTFKKQSIRDDFVI